MKTRKQESEKKKKFAISLNPKIFAIMEKEMINKSKLIEKLLTKYYGDKIL